MKAFIISVLAILVANIILWIFKLPNLIHTKPQEIVRSSQPQDTEKEFSEKTQLPVGSQGGKTHKKVQIGFTISQTGKLSAVSIRQFNGLNLWIEQVNANGGLKLADGTMIKVTSKYYDDESNRERVQELYQKLIDNDHVDFLISPYSSGLAHAAAIVAQQFNKIMITVGAVSDATHMQGFTTIYQTYTPASRYLTGAIDLLAEMGISNNKVAIVHEKDSFSSDVANSLKAYAEKKGFLVPFMEEYEARNKSFIPIINKIHSKGIGALMGGGHYPDTCLLTKEIFERNVKVKMVALQGAPPEPNFANLGDAACGVIGPSQWEPIATYGPNKADVNHWFGPSVGEFVAQYKKRYNQDPTYQSAGGFIAGILLQKAIEQYGSIEYDKVKDALEQTDMYTFWGRLRFDRFKYYGLQIGHEMTYIQWQKDTEGNLIKQVVWPKNARTATAIYYCNN